MYNNEYAKELEKANKHSELFQYVIQYANTQNPQALNMIARCYYYGHGTEKDYSACFLYDQKAADTNDGDALATLGWDYENGVGTEKNIEFALQFYQKSVDLESNKGYCFLGLCYQDGIGIEKDESKAVQYYTVAAERGYAMAQRRLGVCYEYGIGVDKDEIKAFELYTQAAEQGGAISQRYLAECYTYGTGVCKNISKAIEWYTKSAEQGDRKSQQKIGEIYFYGDDDISIDYEKALFWFEKAKALGGVSLWLHLGLCYAYTFKNEDDSVKMFESYVQAVQSEHTDDVYYSNACYQLARCYKNGWGTSPNEQKCFEYYLQSAELGHSDAQCEVGICYENCIGVEKNQVLAIQWYQKAADQGNSVGLYYLAINYLNGIGVEKDLEKAHQYFILSAEQGDVDACRNLGNLFLNGIGVNKSIEESFKWYDLASQQNDAESLFQIAKFYRYGDMGDIDLTKAINYYLRAAEVWDDMYNKALCYVDIGECWEELKSEELAKEYFINAFEIYRKLSDEGDGKATFQLALLYKKGNGVEKNTDRYFELTERANRLWNSGVTHYELALCYEIGTGTNVDKKKAFLLYQKAAKLDEPRSIAYVGYCYENGIGTKKDVRKAISIYKNILDSESHPLTYNLANLYLGLCYYYGTGVKQNEETAHNLWKNDESVGQMISNFLKRESYGSIALIYSHNAFARHYYLTANEDRATNFFMKEYMSKGVANPFVARCVATFFRAGNEIKRNYKRSFEILSNPKIHDNNDPLVLRSLAEHYYYGCGIKRDYVQALNCFEKGVKAGDSISGLYISLCYAYGRGVEQNHTKAREILETLSTDDASIAVFAELLRSEGLWGFKKNTNVAINTIQEIIQNNNNKMPLLKNCYLKPEDIEYLGGLFNHKFRNEIIKLCIARLHFTFDSGVAWKYMFKYYPILFLNAIKVRYFNLGKSKHEIMKQLFEQQKEIQELKTINEESTEKILNLLTQLNTNVNRGFKSLSEQLQSIESFMRNELCFALSQAKIELEQKLAQNIERQEILISEFVSKQAEYINSKTCDMNELLIEEEAYLKGLFGEIWSRLHSDTKSSLKSARVLWRSCSKINNPTFDYSGICISLTAALEMELKRVFFFGFQNYMQRKYGKPHLKPLEWPQELIYSNNGYVGLNNGKNITLGSIPHLLCEESNEILTKRMEEYLSTIMNKKNKNFLSVFNDGGDNSFVSLCEQITYKYRNPAAHTGIIDRPTMIACYHKVIGKMEASEEIGQTTSLLLKLYEHVDIEKVSKYL